MRDQFNSVLNMGPLNQVVGMIPGFNANMIPKGQEKESTDRIKKFVFMMDSMTKEELDCIKPLNESRVLRISKGAGTNPTELLFLLSEHKRFSKMVERMGKMNLDGLDNEQVSTKLFLTQFIVETKPAADDEAVVAGDRPSYAEVGRRNGKPYEYGEADARRRWSRGHAANDGADGHGRYGRHARNGRRRHAWHGRNGRHAEYAADAADDGRHGRRRWHGKHDVSYDGRRNGQTSRHAQRNDAHSQVKLLTS